MIAVQSTMPSTSPSDLAKLAAALSASPELIQLVFDPHRLRVWEQSQRPLTAHLAEWRLEVNAKETTAKHARDTFRYARALIRLSRARRYADLHRTTVVVALSKLRAAGSRPRRPRGIGAATANLYLGALRSFCKWMIGEHRAIESPCADIKRFNADTDVRRRRRVFTDDEKRRLVAATTTGKTIAGISGPERAALYALAMTAGLRSKEAQSLGARSFKIVEGPNSLLILEAHEAKGKKRAEIPLREDVARRLREHVNNAGRTERLFRRSSKPMREFCHDLKVAGIQYCVDGEYADFHALRHTYCTGLADSGAPVKELQTLARHADVRTTLKYYVHASRQAQRDCVERLAPLDVPSPLDERTETHAITRPEPTVTSCDSPPFAYAARR